MGAHARLESVPVRIARGERAGIERQPRVELLWWEGCPSWPRALEMLCEAMRANGLDPESIELRQIATDADAERESFPGSPTIRVDGQDIQPAGENPIGLSCRVYRLRDGRTSPLPDPEELDEALRGAEG